MDNQELAQAAYAAYGRTTDFKNYQGLSMPEWKLLPPIIQEAWTNSAVTVAIISKPPKEPVNGVRSEPTWSKSSPVVYAKDWRDLLDQREQKTLANALDYAQDPFGDMGHNLKVILAKLATFLDQSVDNLNDPNSD